MNESFTPKLELSFDEAKAEADLMKAYLEINPTWGTIKRWDDSATHPTKEEYELALKKIEELKQEVAKEPELKKILYKIGRAAHTGKELLELLLTPNVSELRQGLREKNSVTTTGLIDPAKELKNLQKGAKEYSKN